MVMIMIIIIWICLGIGHHFFQWFIVIFLSISINHSQFTSSGSSMLGIIHISHHIPSNKKIYGGSINGGTTKSSILDGDFPWNKPSSYWGNPMCGTTQPCSAARPLPRSSEVVNSNERACWVPVGRPTEPIETWDAEDSHFATWKIRIVSINVSRP